MKPGDNVIFNEDHRPILQIALKYFKIDIPIKGKIYEVESVTSEGLLDIKGLYTPANVGPYSPKAWIPVEDQPKLSKKLTDEIMNNPELQEFVPEELEIEN